MRTLLILFLSAISVVAQPVFPPAFWAPAKVSGAPPATYTPTNIAGYPALAAYVMSDLVTNSSVWTVPDRWTNHWDLTNRAATSKWPPRQVAVLGGKDVIGIDGLGMYCRNLATTSSQPFEIDIMVNFTNSAANIMLIDAGQVSPRSQAFYTDSSGIKFGTTPVNAYTSGGSSLSNHFVWYSFEFQGTKSNLYTNGVATQFTDQDAGSNPHSGLTLGTYYELSPSGVLQIAEVVIFNNIPITNAVARASLSNYFHNTYGVP